MRRVAGEVIGRRGIGGRKTGGAGEGLFAEDEEEEEDEGEEEEVEEDEYASLFMVRAATCEAVYGGCRRRTVRWEGG